MSAAASTVERSSGFGDLTRTALAGGGIPTRRPRLICPTMRPCRGSEAGPRIGARGGPCEGWPDRRQAERDVGDREPLGAGGCRHGVTGVRRCTSTDLHKLHDCGHLPSIEVPDGLSTAIVDRMGRW